MDLYLIKDLIRTGIEILVDYAPWVGWNMFLALIPLYLSIFLFRRDVVWPWQRADQPRSHRLSASRRAPLWWLGFALFIAFLPNAPYILTDVIHLNEAVLAYNSMWVTGFILFPFYVVFLGTGFWAYVLSLMNFGHYLQQRGWGRYIFQVELILHGLCSIGVFVGRFPRLNSWYFVTQPWRVGRTLLYTLLSPEAVLAIIVGFVILTLLYIPAKKVTQAIVADRKNRSFSVVVE
jgi:uncharacterized membrane protein